MVPAFRIDRPAAARAPSAHVLVVEDDPTVAEVVTRYLERDGHRVDVIGDGVEALATLAGALPDLIVLDLMLPGLPGLELCRRVRERSDVPILILSARGEEDDRLRGLELGADDYLAKPFSPRELAARVRAVLRRAPPPVSAPLAAGPVRLDPRTREVTVRDRPVSLTAREFDLLAHFLRSPGEAFRRETLLKDVWGYTFGDTSTVTVHVRRLREKLEEDPSAPRHLETVWGVGYRFVA